MTARPTLALLVCGALGALLACNDPPQVKPDKSPDAGASNAPVENAHIAEALASAAKGTGPSAGEGPPANGIFGPGGADRAQAKNAPINVSLIDKGADPKIKLTPLLELNKAQPLDVTVVRVEQGSMGRSVVAVTFSLAAITPAEEAPEPKAPPDTEAKDAPKDEKKAPESEIAKPITSPRTIMFSVIGVRPASQKDIPLSEDEIKKLEKLKGATISAKLAPDGSISAETFELPKDTDPTAGHTVRVLAETIGLFFSPLPSEPVGKGAYWIASDRSSLAGMDVVRYRVTKIEELDGDEALLSLDLRVYAASNAELPTGAAEGAVGMMFQAQGKAEFGRKGGALVPVSTQALELQIMMQIAPSADAQVAQVYQHKTVGILQPPQAPEDGDGPAKDQPKKQAPPK